MGNSTEIKLAAREAATRDAATPCAWQNLSTREVPEAERFEFWRQFQTAAQIERPTGARGDFFAELKLTATSDGVAFGELEIDPCVSRFGPGGDDSVVDIGMIKAGTMHIRYGRDQTMALHAGAGPVLFDPARPMTTRTTRSDLAYLRLPRAVVVAALGEDAIPHGIAVRPFAPDVLTAQLAACLRGLSGESAAKVTDVLHTASALALVVLANVRGAGHHWPGNLDNALYRAARHQFSLRVGDAQLTVDAVAAVLGCSRAQLYRLFAARGESVAGCLRELRMQRAADLLEASPRNAIGAIAARCGYSEPFAFDKAFRRRFGMTPSDWRAMRAGADRSVA